MHRVQGDTDRQTDSVTGAENKQTKDTDIMYRVEGNTDRQNSQIDKQIV